MSDRNKPQKVRRVKFFSMIDVEAIREYLEDMAAKGFFFTGRTGIFYTFEMGNPEKRRYFVDLFHDGTFSQNNKNSEETRNYISGCETRGWKHLCTDGRHLFFTAEEDAEPIRRDSKAQLRMMLKCIKYETVLMLVLAFLCGWDIGFYGIANTWPTEFIEYGSLSLLWIAMLVFFLASSCRNIIFYAKNRKQAAAGKPIRFPGSRTAEWFQRVMLLLLLTGLIALAIQFFAGEISSLLAILFSAAILLPAALLASHFLKKRSGRLAKTRLAAGIVVIGIAAAVLIVGMSAIIAVFDGHKKTIEYHDEDGNLVYESVFDEEIPLVLSDLGIDTKGLIEADKAREGYISIYGSVTDCWQNYYDEHGELDMDLSYNIAVCRFGWVKDRLLKEYMTTDYYGRYSAFQDITRKEAAYWDAQQVYSVSLEDGGYARLVVYEDVILFITNSEMDYTEKMIEIITDKLQDQLN